MNTTMLHECLEGAFQGSISFPETVRRMSADYIERYHADLVRLEKTHYDAAGASHVEKMPLDGAPPESEFRADGVKEALAAIQQRKIDYPEFLRRIMAAGITDYTVYIDGRRAIYTGRTGDSYVEPFPPQP